MRKSEKTCYILAAACLVLGLLIQSVFTSVRFTGFLFCCAAAALAVFALLSRWKGKYRWALWLRRGFLALLAAGFAFFAVLEARVVSWARTDLETPVAAVIVLGAGVNGTEPSLSLRTRLDAALDYARARPGIPIVLTGAQGAGEAVSEARCMAEWLAERGIGRDRMVLEERARNTEENIGYSLRLLEEMGVDTTENIAVVSSDYHLCRASMYMTGNMVPVAAAMPGRYWPLILNYFVREAFGVAEELVF